MDAREIRKKSNLSQKRFAEDLNIPLGTLRNWEQGISEPPEYLLELINDYVEDKMRINLQTVKFMHVMDELAEALKKGLRPFSEATQETNAEGFFYDNANPDDNGNYRIVLDACVIDEPGLEHHDVVSYYDSQEYLYDCKIRYVAEPEDGEPYIKATVGGYDDHVVVEPGNWYVIS